MAAGPAGGRPGGHAKPRSGSDEVELVAEGDTNMVSAEAGPRRGPRAALVFAGCTGDDDDEATEDLEGAFASVEESNGEIAIDTGQFELLVETDPLRIATGDDFVRRRRPKRAACTWSVTARRCGVGPVIQGGGRRGVAGRHLRRRHNRDPRDLPERPGTVAFAPAPAEPAGVTHWGEMLAMPEDELIYGLTERTVTGQAESEIFPEEVGSLDRRGEVVDMAVALSIAGYKPFHQSSRGTACWSTAPCRAATTSAPPIRASWTSGSRSIPTSPPAATSSSTDPSTRESSTSTPLHGPPVRGARCHLPALAGRDEWVPGTPVEVAGVAINPTIADLLDTYEQLDLPAGVLHFDRPWAVGTEGFGDLRFDPERFPNTEQMLDLLEEQGWTSQVWVSPWALDERGVEAEAGLLAPDSDRYLDLTNPDAVAFLQEDLTGASRGRRACTWTGSSSIGPTASVRRVRHRRHVGGRPGSARSTTPIRPWPTRRWAT